MNQFKFLALVAMLFVFGVSATAQHHMDGKKAASQNAPDFTAVTPDAFRAELGQSAQAYLALKDALVSTDPKTAKTEASRFLSTLDKVEMELVKGDAHMYWMKQLKALKEHGAGVFDNNNVEGQRKEFSLLSNALAETLLAFGSEETLYLQHCPMALGEGADWLSADEAIKNPYFGKKMLGCGFLKETLPANEQASRNKK